MAAVCKHLMIVFNLFVFDIHSLSLSLSLSSLLPFRTNRNLQPIDVNHHTTGGSPKPCHKRGSSSISIQTTSSKDSTSTVTSGNSAKASFISLR